jgi:NADH-quinone oxidoreductase subunit C
MDGELRIPSDKLRAAVEGLVKKGFDHVKSIAGIDDPEGGRIELVYHFSSYSNPDSLGKIVELRTDVGRKKPEMVSIADLLPSARYIELEIRDFFGVRFEGNESPNPLILPEEMKGTWPLRKEFTIPEEEPE